MRTAHEIVLGDARRLDRVDSESVDLLVTSPPYPLVEMWDPVFAGMSAPVGKALTAGDGEAAFEGMHAELDKVWAECWRVLKPGSIACINVGDAARTLGGEFRLWPNHSRMVSALVRLGFHTLPDILWRKPTNAPNKFLGSGMLPPGAYVTYEHEYVLVLRKGALRRLATTGEKELRRRSAYFWEERNVWFSDIWMDLKGERQRLDGPEPRARSGAFPFELAYRLIQMFSLIGDRVLDPFLGTGTTTAAAVASARSSVGVDIEPGLLPAIHAAVEGAPEAGRRRLESRLADHRAFVAGRESAGKPLKHWNEPHGFPVVTGQETELFLPSPVRCTGSVESSFSAEHEDAPSLPVKPSRKRATHA